MATFTKLPSGSWRTQVRRKGKYASETFLLRGDAEIWARETERRIDRGEPILSDTSATKTFAGLIDLHRRNLAEIGKAMGRSKDASLASLHDRLGKLRPVELDRERVIAFANSRAKEGADPLPLCKNPQALLSMLYRSTDRLRRGGAPVKNLAHSPSLHSPEEIAPSNAGTKQIGMTDIP